MIFGRTDILLPNISDFRKWAVIACDQFTSQPEYWARVHAEAKDMLSSLHLILPEAQLSNNNDEQIAHVHAVMEAYVKDHIFTEYCNSYVYVERVLKNGCVRKGIVGAIDLEEYDYTPNSQSKIRATEETVPDRIPPRVKIRENAILELPHVLLLCDDRKHLLLECIENLKNTMPILYDFDLMQDGGHITGWHVFADKADIFETALRQYLQETGKKYESMGEKPLFFIVGDGNHSLAAAKECYERKKLQYGSNIRARYALVELENMQDDAQKFEPIHRLLKHVDPGDVLQSLREKICTVDGGYKIEYYTDKTHGELYLDEKLGELPVAILQKFLDSYIASHSGTMDYIHGEGALKLLCAEANTIGFCLPAIDKKKLFNGIIEDGVLPRKTFSIGVAQDKRYYIEAREID